MIFKLDGDDFLEKTIESLRTFKTLQDLKNAVDTYTENKQRGICIYGDINTWNVSSVEDMSELFKNKVNFNEPLDSWDTSNVKNMKGMFENAKSFNKPLDSWDISKVESMEGMFEGAESMLRIYPNLNPTPKKISWEDNFNRAKPTKGAQH